MAAPHDPIGVAMMIAEHDPLPLVANNMPA